MMMVRVRRWNPRHAAIDIEQHAPDSRNVVITAEELLRTERWRAAVRSRVLRDAAAVASTVDVKRAIPMGRAAVYCASASDRDRIGSLRHAAHSRRIRCSLPAHRIRRSGRWTAGVTAIVTPPSYLRISPHTLTDPERIDAVAGSTLELRIAGTAAWSFDSGPRDDNGAHRRFGERHCPPDRDQLCRDRDALRRRARVVD